MIQAKNVSFSYQLEGRKTRVLRDFDLDVEAGEMVAIQGPSGSGKSTLLYILGGLLKPDAGEILIDGENIYKASAQDLAFFRNRKMGFIFQQFHLLPRATVKENAVLPSKYPCELGLYDEKADQRATELLDQVGLSEYLENRPNQLSGGQQQRVAIARALLNDPPIILADEPTGNLDSKNAQQIIDLLKKINRETGKTILIITHDPEIAKQCSKIVHFRDGKIVEIEELGKRNPVQTKEEEKIKKSFHSQTWQMFRTLLPLSMANILRNKMRSFSTMLGVTIGIAAILSMVTFGEFTQTKILESYQTLGVNKVRIRARHNRNQKATDKVRVAFEQFDWEKDIRPFRKAFPEIDKLSPMHWSWQLSKTTYGGRSFEDNPVYLGINEQYLSISNIELLFGKNISQHHVSMRSPVCIIGFSVAKEVFKQTHPIGKILTLVKEEGVSYPCKVVGVMKSIKSNKGWFQPNNQILLPQSYFQIISERWNAQFRQMVVQVKQGSDIEKFTKAAKYFFEKKYGKSARFHTDADSILIAQVAKFLTLFKTLLGAIAIISLIVGGIGITNMMLASMSDQLREIGVRKAFGATNRSVRMQYLLESFLLCSIAGIAGIVLGFAAYQTIIFIAAKFVDTLTFEWLFDPIAVFASLLSIVLIGIGSGLIPAIKAEKLQVIEALRSD